jgi:hypothetical protein
LSNVSYRQCFGIHMEGLWDTHGGSGCRPRSNTEHNYRISQTAGDLSGGLTVSSSEGGSWRTPSPGAWTGTTCPAEGSRTRQRGKEDRLCC